ncbi:MAG: hypothetical protein JWQ38_1089 [Flavipsychrobacter sp.]|nr:hypothetical protein [Flavipsychrobacter sp.]
MDSATEQMEAHRKYVDVQYMITGAELVGHMLYSGQVPSKEYSDAEDFMLFPDTPSFFSLFSAGTFMVFFPTDLHMPCIKVTETAKVKKIVIKVRVQ